MTAAKKNGSHFLMLYLLKLFKLVRKLAEKLKRVVYGLGRAHVNARDLQQRYGIGASAA